MQVDEYTTGLRRRGWRVLGLAGCGAVGTLALALTLRTPLAVAEHKPPWAASLLLGAAPLLDASVDWSQVETAQDFGAAAVAAYER